MQRLVEYFYSRLFLDGFQASIESWKLKADIDTICARLFRTKVILISVTRSLTPARYHKEITSTIVEQAVKVTARISYLVETENDMWRLYDNVKKLEQLLLDIESFVRSETQAIFLFKEDLYSRYTELLERLTHILGLFEVFERSVLYSSSHDDSLFGIIKLQAATPQRNRNQFEGEVDMQQSSTRSVMMDNTAYPSNLTAEGRNVAEPKEIDSQKEVGDKRTSIFPQVQNVVITGRTIYSVDGDYMVSNAREAAPGLAFRPRLFALIIGISRYKAKELDTLYGAELDALAFKSYLENDLHVPVDQIEVLLSDQATRSNIIEAFEKMATNSSIFMEDPIVIYYAGHCTEQVEATNPRVRRQIFVPHDFSTGPAKAVGPIANRQIEKLIENIATNKGDNITVILDCCHAGSATRASAEGLRSHMLIAACGALEDAKEFGCRGNFSVALLKLLKKYSPDKLRYCDILTQIDAIHGQNPQCEGKNQHRILFSTKVATPARTFLVNLGEPSPQGYASIIVEAGSVQGVTEGTEFALYSVDDLRFEEPLALATVKSVAAFTATLNHLAHFDVARACVAIQTKAGQKEDVRLFVPLGDAFHAVFESVRDNQDNSKYNLHNITLVADQTIAHLKATVKEADMLLEMTDERVTRYGFSQLFKAVDIHDSERMGRMFSRIAHFYRELNRANSDDKLTSRVHIEFYQLEENDNGELDTVGENLCNEGTIDLVVNNTPYSMRLINESPYDLYPYLFWFDNTDLSIKDCYLSPGHPNTPYEQDIPLPRRNGNVYGELTIGYGSGDGYQPFNFPLKDGQYLDVSFFKLFISTRPLDLSYISQGACFSPDIPPTSPSYMPQLFPMSISQSSLKSVSRSSPKSVRRGGLRAYIRRVDRWDAILIPVVQRRDPSLV